MGCRDSNPGECVPCAECESVNGEKMVRVGCISDAGRTDEAGECKPARMVVRTPLCPEAVTDAFGDFLFAPIHYHVIMRPNRERLVFIGTRLVTTAPVGVFT